METEASISSVSVSGISSQISSGGQKINRSLEALCNVADSAYRTISQPTSSSVSLTVKPDASPPVFTTHTIVPMITSIGNISWNVIKGAAPTSSVVIESERNVAQIFPFVQCYVPSNSSGCLSSTPTFLRSHSIGLPVANNLPQIIVAPPVAIETANRHNEHSSPSSSSGALQRQRKSYTETTASAGRHICKFCGRACAKPSVLQKHIRTHTGERPYPCPSCDLHFKTKSNLYKHRKSRTHQHGLTMAGVDDLDRSANQIKTSKTDNSSLNSVLSHAGEPSGIDSPCCQPSLGGSECDLSTESNIEQQGACRTSIPDNPDNESEWSCEGVGENVHLSNGPIDNTEISDNTTSNILPSARNAVGDITKQSDSLNVRSEPLQDRISRLISQNASIINNTPVAEAPRQKRILRQSSDVVGSQTTKSGITKPLLRAKSLNPSEKVSAKELEIQTLQSSVSKTVDSTDCLLGLPISSSVASVKLPTEAISKTRYLTVPGENTLFDYGVRHVTTDAEVDHSPGVLSGNIRIVLELCEGANDGLSYSSEMAPVNTSVASLPVVVSSPLAYSPTQPLRINVSSPSIVAPSSMASSVSPALCLVRPLVERHAASSNSQLLHAQSDPVMTQFPIKYVIVSENNSSELQTTEQTVVKTGLTSAGSSTNFFHTVSLSNLPPRRGRPKGSKNRPKLAASSSDPQTKTFPASTSASSSSPLWKVKLKDQLLLRRSLSTEKACSNEGAFSFEKVAYVASTISKSELTPSSQIPITVQSLVCSTDKSVLTIPNVCEGDGTNSNTCVNTDAAGHLISLSLTRSLSCDTSVPPKKRKALTELGRGTAFGTRVEDMAGNKEVANTVSTEVAVIDDVGYVGNSVGCVDKQAPPTVGVDLCTDIHSVMHVSSSEAEHLFNPARQFDNVLSLGVSEANNGNGSDSEVSCVALGRGDLGQLLAAALQSAISSAQSVSESNKSPVVIAMSPSVATSSSGNNRGTVVIPQLCRDEWRHMEPSTSKTVDAQLLLSHSCPSISIETKPSFSRLFPPQQFQLNVSNSASEKPFLYISTSPNLVNDLSKSTPETFASYRTVRKGADTRYAAALGVDDKRLGILTHSSYWNYRKDKSNVEDTESEDNMCEVIVQRMGSFDKLQTAEFIPSSASSNEDMLTESMASCSLVMSSASENAEQVNAKLVPSITQTYLLNSHSKLISTKSQPAEITGKKTWVCPGGYRSLESYVYVRGRGRGNYVCATCGVRCKKPSILRKHLHLHTDLRPHHCSVCNVGFKTKGNLSKHLNSKVHQSRSDGNIVGSVADTDDRVSESPLQTVIDEQSDTGISQLHHHGSNAEVETDSGCELQHGSSCEVDPDNGNFPGTEPELLRQNSDGEEIGDDIRRQGVHNFDHSVSTKHQHRSADCCGATSFPHSSAAIASTCSLAIDSSVTSPSAVYSKTLEYVSTSDTPPVSSTGIGRIASHDVETSDMETNADAPATLFCSQQPKSELVKQFAVVGLFSVSKETAQMMTLSDGTSRCEADKHNSHGNVATKVNQTSTLDEDNSSPKSAGAMFNNGVRISSNKASHKLNRVNAIDLTVGSTADVSSESTSEVCSNSREAISVQQIDVGRATETVISAVTTGHVKPSTTKRCEIFPVPGRVSAEGVRIGTSYACPVCRKQFSSAARLTLHRHIHFLERPARCPTCHASFASRTMLEKHRVTEHHTVGLAQAANNPRPHKCDECGIAFRILGHLAKHKRSKSHAARIEIMPSVHVNLSEDVSDVGVDLTIGVVNKDSEVALVQSPGSLSKSCLLQQSVADLDARTEYSSQLPVGSSAVDSSGPVELNLLLPVQSTTDQVKEGNLSDHTCDFCGKTLADFTAFKKHLTSHIERRPFVCEDCDAGFTTAHLLAEHKKIHAQAHVCDICGNRAEHREHTQPHETNVKDSSHGGHKET